MCRKSSTKVLLVFVAAAVILAVPCFGTTVVIDEFTGVCNTTTGCTSSLQFAPVTGQLRLTDNNVLLDVITFDHATSSYTFASDNIDGFDAPADTFGPPPALTNVVTLPEPVSENGFEIVFYTPTPGQPGYALDSLGKPVTYKVISDSPGGVYTVDYFPNLKKYDGLKKVVNDGIFGDTPQTGSLCDLIYVFQREQLSECCGCYVTPNGSRDFDVNKNFNSNDFRGMGPYDELIVKQISSGPLGASSDFSCSVSPDGSVSCRGACDPTAPEPRVGLHSWAAKTQVIGSLAPHITETPSQAAGLGGAELTDLAEDCAVAIELGSGTGLCSCGTFD